MRYVFRALTVILAVGFVAHLSLAQRSMTEAGEDIVGPRGSDSKEDYRNRVNEAVESLKGGMSRDGTRESHQGADNARQGGTGFTEGRFGGPDAYAAEGYHEMMQRLERQLNDPQWQLKIDLMDPKRVVVNYPDGSTEEYWYVMFRVINDNIRRIKETELPTKNPEDGSIGSPAKPLEVTDLREGQDSFEGVPVNCHLDFVFTTFTRDIGRDPWDDENYPVDPENDVITGPGLEQRQAQMKKEYRPVSDPYVLQRIAEQEGMYEWMGNWNNYNEAVMLLHPLSDFQRQVGFAHRQDAPDLSGPRCVAYRDYVIGDNGRVETIRYVALNGDNAFVGYFTESDALPEGARLINSTSDEMWGKLSALRYQAGDCIDRYGHILRANEPGFLNARVAGGRKDENLSRGAIGPEHPAVGQLVLIPKARVYREGEKVLKDFDTGIKHDDYPNETYKVSGKIVSPSDPRAGSATDLSGEWYEGSGDVAGRPVKMLDKRGRALRRYIVTYQPGDKVTEAEWNIWKARLGPGILSRYGSEVNGITSRALTFDDPLIGLPKIKMGRFVGDAELNKPEVIQRGIRKAGESGERGVVKLELVEYTTGRSYDPRKIDPAHFARDPEGEFSTNRIAPVGDSFGLDEAQKYVYAPLGDAAEDAVPVPRFDQYGAWVDYTDELSGSRIMLLDDKGELVRDHLDQILYLKEYEYEYMYMYEYAPIPMTESIRTMDAEGGIVEADGGMFKGPYEGERASLAKAERVYYVEKETTITTVVRNAQGQPELGADGQPKVTQTKVKVRQPLMRLIYETKMVDEPTIVDGYEYIGADGKIEYLTADEYQTKAGSAPSATTLKVQIVRSVKVPQKVVVGVYNEGKTLTPEQKAAGSEETWEAAKARAEAEGGKVTESDTDIAFVDRYRREHAAKTGADAHRLDDSGPNEDEYETTTPSENALSLDHSYYTWSRWTVPPPVVYQDAGGQWKVLTRFAEKVGPANRWDGMDAPRFLTRYVSEMWGVAIFKGVDRDWDFANVVVKGLRGRVANAGLEHDQSVTSLPAPSLEVEGGRMKTNTKTFFNPRYATEEWIYRVRYERLGDEFENFRDLIRRVRTFWYRDEAASGTLTR